MKVHTFTAASATDAVAQIRAQLGPAAIVLNVRQLPTPGISRLWQKPRIEVVACLPPENAPIGWAAAGGIGGLIYGIGRAGEAIGQNWMRYAVYLLLGLAFLLLMLNAMISGGH